MLLFLITCSSAAIILSIVGFNFSVVAFYLQISFRLRKTSIAVETESNFRR